MRAQDFLIEGATDVLYHKTSTRSAANILKDGVFKLASSVGTQAEEQYAPPGRPYFLSTSRSKAGDYARWVGSSEVMFNLNGQWLAQRYKVKPIDYWERAWQHSPERTSEGEDRVFSKDPEISIECVTAVHAFIKSADEWRSPYTRQVLLVAKQRGIPAYLYTDPQAWKLQDTRKAVSPQQAAALLKGSTPVRKQYKPASSYLEPWLELIYKKAKSELSPAAEKLRHNLVYYGLRYPNEDSGLASDMNNSRKPDSPDYANVDKLIKFMRANRLAKPTDLKNALAQKWDAINTKEQESAKGQQPVAEGVPQPGESSGAPKQFGPDAKIQTRQMTVKDIISSVPGVPYYNNVVDDWDAKDYSWGVTKKVIEYATYLKDHPESLAKLPPAIVLNGKFEDGAHRVSAIWLLQQRMDPKNPIWANAKLNVQFVKQGVAEDTGANIPPVLYHATYKQRLKSIQLKGLGAAGKRNWTDSKRGIVYLALDPDVAESYAETALDDLDADWDIVILKISTSGLDTNKFQLDRNVLDNEGDTLEYHGIIPPGNIGL
jgi:hypothetical protein